MFGVDIDDAIDRRAGDGIVLHQQIDCLCCRLARPNLDHLLRTADIGAKGIVGDANIGIAGVGAQVDEHRLTAGCAA